MKRRNYCFLAIGPLLIFTLTACDVNIASEVLSSSAVDRNYPRNRERFSYW